MANPFKAKFDSNCNSCGDPISEGDNVFVIDDQFVCESCAELNGNVCPDCGDFKKEEYEQCYSCNQDRKEDNENEHE